MRPTWIGLRLCRFFYETDTFKAVHACWDNTTIDFLKNTLDNGRLTDEVIYQSVKQETNLNEAIELTLKGKEIKLPEGMCFEDTDGTIRNEIRIKWWEDPAKMTYKSISVEPIDVLTTQPIEVNNLISPDFYSCEDKNVFFGHYWLKGNPTLYKNNICCLDYSVAKEGKLVAYRYNGESILKDRNFIYVL